MALETILAQLRDVITCVDLLCASKLAFARNCDRTEIKLIHLIFIGSQEYNIINYY